MAYRGIVSLFPKSAQPNLQYHLSGFAIWVVSRVFRKIGSRKYGRPPTGGVLAAIPTILRKLKDTTNSSYAVGSGGTHFKPVTAYVLGKTERLSAFLSASHLNCVTTDYTDFPSAAESVVCFLRRHPERWLTVNARK